MVSLTPYIVEQQVVQQPVVIQQVVQLPVVMPQPAQVAVDGTPGVAYYFRLLLIGN